MQNYTDAKSAELSQERQRAAQLAPAFTAFLAQSHAQMLNAKRLLCMT